VKTTAKRAASHCRSCGAPLLWAVTEKGRRIPLDPDPYTGDDPRGLYVLRNGNGAPLAVATTPDAFPGEPVYRSHFASCDDPARFRRKATPA
jgi:hypothetical protein